MTASPGSVTQAAQPVQPAARRGRPGYDLESLLAVAAKLFNERGYDGTSMEDLSAGWASPNRPSTTTCPASGGYRLAIDRALDALFAEAAKLERVDGRAIDRLEHLVRGSVLVLTRDLPFVTLLLRVRGNTRSSGRRWLAAAGSTTWSPTWSLRPRPRATCGPTSTPPSPPGCCLAWSTP